MAGLSVRVDMVVGGVAQDFGDVVGAQPRDGRRRPRDGDLHRAARAAAGCCRNDQRRVRSWRRQSATTRRRPRDFGRSSADIRLTPIGVILPPAERRPRQFSISPDACRPERCRHCSTRRRAVPERPVAAVARPAPVRPSSATRGTSATEEQIAAERDAHVLQPWHAFGHPDRDERPWDFCVDDAGRGGGRVRRPDGRVRLLADRAGRRQTSCSTRTRPRPRSDT